MRGHGQTHDSFHDFQDWIRSRREYGNAVMEHGDWNATFRPENGGQPVGGTYLTAYARLADGSVRAITCSTAWPR
jgi:hypothetical protein